MVNDSLKTSKNTWVVDINYQVGQSYCLETFSFIECLRSEKLSTDISIGIGEYIFEQDNRQYSNYKRWKSFYWISIWPRN